MQENNLLLGGLASWLPPFRELVGRRLIYWKPNLLYKAFGFFVRNFLQRKIWYFKTDLRQFLRLAFKVYTIDRKNYAGKNNKSR